MSFDALAQYFGRTALLRLDRGAHEDVAHFRLHAVPRLGGTLAQAVASVVGKVANGQYGHRMILYRGLYTEYCNDSNAVNQPCPLMGEGWGEGEQYFRRFAAMPLIPSFSRKGRRGRSAKLPFSHEVMS